jgi:hypothetical protein
MHFRRIRRNPATGRRRATAQVPQQPHAATAPPVEPTALYAAEHTYLPSTAQSLRAHAEWCLGKVADAQTRIDELHDWIAHWRAEAADHFRIADLVELDGAASARESVARPGPAMCTDELLETPPAAGDRLVNGWQAMLPQLPDTLTLPVVTGAQR